MIYMTKYNAVISMTALALTNASEKSSVNRNTLVINYLGIITYIITYIYNITRYIYPTPLHTHIYIYINTCSLTILSQVFTRNCINCIKL